MRPDPDMLLSDYVFIDQIEKERKLMNFHDVQVVVCGKTYMPNYFDWEQTPGDFPRIKVDATICPHSMTSNFKATDSSKPLTIENVIFNPPATIVFWSDGTKTVVKADGEAYDPEKGIAMAISKKLMGDNKYEYYHTFLHWLKKWNKQTKSIDERIQECEDKINDLEAYMHEECY